MPEKLTWGVVEIDTPSHTVSIDGRLRPEFTRSEVMILEILVLTIGNIVSNEMARKHLYGADWEKRTDHNIKTHVYRIRKRMARLGVNQEIETEWGRGYYIQEIHRLNGKRSE